MKINSLLFELFFWRVKLCTKLLVRLLPIKYESWRFFNLFKHGNMEDSSFSIQFFNEFFLAHVKNSKIKILEIGPGDSLNTALLGYAYNFEKTYLLDLGFQAHQNLDQYRSFISKLNQMTGQKVSVMEFSSIAEMLEKCRAQYFTGGVNSLNEIETNSVDVIASNAVLEHLNVESIQYLMSQTYRILSDDGTAIHRIDFRDHIFGNFRHLNFSSEFSESDLIKRSGNYLNRLHLNQYMEIAKVSNLQCKISRIMSEDKPSKMKFNASVSSDWVQDSSLVRSVDLVLKKQLS